MFENAIRGVIDADELIVGQGVVVEAGATITGIDGPAHRVVIGDHAYVGKDSVFRVPSLEIGDYTTIHRNVLVYGTEPTRIGHNGWIGQNTILNSTAALTIGDNCGIGAYSQLWTHILYGDVMNGCRFDTSDEMTIGKDVWFVGHCIVSPITAHDRSMALAGSVVTRDMADNHVYGGSPAIDLTEKVGPQFRGTTEDERVAYLTDRLAEFKAANPLSDAEEIGIQSGGVTIRTGPSSFDVSDRTYTKLGTAAEVAFMRFLLPRAKFTPRSVL